MSRLYGATRRIVGSVFGGEERRFFRDVVLFEYPSPGQWTLGFRTGKAPRPPRGADPAVAPPVREERREGS